MNIAEYSFPMAYTLKFEKICTGIRQNEQILLQIISEDCHCLIQHNKTWQFRKSSNHAFLEFESESHFKRFLFDNLPKIVDPFCELRVIIPSKGLSILLHERFSIIRPQLDLILLYCSFDVVHYVIPDRLKDMDSIKIYDLTYCGDGIDVFILHQGRYLDLKSFSYLYFNIIKANYF